MSLLNNMSPIEKERFLAIIKDPVKWSQSFIKIFNPVTKQVEPWIARWYQVEMLRDFSTKKVYRCGRRTGKTETMVVDMLWRIFNRRNYRIVVATPYENQIRLIFMRINEILLTSPLLNNEVIKNTKNPYIIQFANGSAVIGFTTGNDAASVRGQKADWLYLDEVDYMDDVCFDAVTTIAAEREAIGITMSSTPTGARSHFYKACTDKKMGFKQHYHPSTHNPNWGPTMESEFRAQLTEQAYVHEILAEFGTQEKGVFNKDKLDLATKTENYAYNELLHEQKVKCEREQCWPTMYLYDKRNKPMYHPFRTMGVDWDKYGASSSVIILEYDVIREKFKVIKRVEVPRGEYSYDNAINIIVELNAIYNPSFIYCDAGAGEYQIERLHIIGDEQPQTGLKHKVKRWSFSNNVDIVDPITFEKTKEPVKQFMINQLQIAFDREKLMLSQHDHVLLKQLTDYEVERFGQNNRPIFTSENEHFIDALGLSYLAFVLEFKELTGTIKNVETSTKISFSHKTLGQTGLNRMFNEIQSTYTSEKAILNYDPTERPGDRPTQVKVSSNYRQKRSSNSWGTRSAGIRGGGSGRSSW